MKCDFIHLLAVLQCFVGFGNGALLPRTDRHPENQILFLDSLSEVASSSRRAVKQGTKLRILPVGDSITVGYLSDRDGGDGNGYLLRLRDKLKDSGDEVVFAGTEHYPESTMTDNYFAAWSGRTIKYIDDNVSPSLAHRPNIILLHAGTNDMNPNHAVSKEGNDPVEAAERLGDLLDHLIRACPDAVIVVATIIGTCNVLQAPQTAKLQYLIPGIVESRADDGHHVLSANFSGWSSSDLRDCIHPTNDGYAKLGEYWYDAMTKIPPSWISAPVGPDPERPPEDSGSVRSKAIGLSQALSVLFVVWFHGFWW